MNSLDPIEELYDMYSDKKETPRIIKVVDNGLRLDLDLEDGLANYKA